MEGFQNLPAWVVDPLQCLHGQGGSLGRSLSGLLAVPRVVGAKTFIAPDSCPLLAQHSPPQ